MLKQKLSRIYMSSRKGFSTLVNKLVRRGRGSVRDNVKRSTTVWAAPSHQLTRSLLPANSQNASKAGWVSEPAVLAGKVKKGGIFDGKSGRMIYNQKVALFREMLKEGFWRQPGFLRMVAGNQDLHTNNRKHVKDWTEARLSAEGMFKKGFVQRVFHVEAKGHI